MTNLAKLHTATGQTIMVGKQLGMGGEGAVFAIEGRSGLAAKIYHEDRRASRVDKIVAMTSARLHATAANVAYPIDLLLDQRDEFIGFTMRRVSGHHAIHNLYSPTSRRVAFRNTNNFRFLLRTALNIARSLANVHHAGCVVGDINHSGILIANDATVTWIDSDSFQVRAGRQLFPCAVGTPEFTPPELQGKQLHRLTRTANHDAFGLAVIIFNLLFMGRHPFSGRYLSSGEMPLERAIEEFRFAYSARRNRTRMEPPPNVPLLTDIPADMRDAFETAFGKAGVTERPQAADWVRLVESAEKQVVVCRASAAHQYLKPARSCPWCRMEAAFPGFVAFTTTATSSRASLRGGANNQRSGPRERRNDGFGAAFYAIVALAGLLFLCWLATFPHDETYRFRNAGVTVPRTTPYTPPRDDLGFNRDGQRGGSGF